MTLIKFRFCAMSLNEPFLLAKALSKSGNFGNKILTHFLLKRSCSSLTVFKLIGRLINGFKSHLLDRTIGALV